MKISSNQKWPRHCGNCVSFLTLINQEAHLSLLDFRFQYYSYSYLNYSNWRAIVYYHCCDYMQTHATDMRVSSEGCQDISSYAISTYAISTAANSTVHNFNRLQFHPFTLSTVCNFNLRQFQPITLPPNCSQTVLIMKAFMVISKAKKRVQQLTIIFHTMKCDNYLQRFSSINSEVNWIVTSPHNKPENFESQSSKCYFKS